MTKGKHRGERAQTTVEFALVSVVFFLIIFGIIDTARLLQSWVSLQHATREGARYAITGRIDCSGSTGRAPCIVWTTKYGTIGLAGGGPNASDSVVAVTTKAADFDGSTWGAWQNNKVGKGCDQVEVKVTYTHKFITPMVQALLPGGVPLTGSQIMTNEPFDSCQINDGVG